GLVTATHLDELSSVLTAGTGISAALSGVVAAAAHNPGLTGFLVTAAPTGGGLVVHPLDVTANGDIVVRGLSGPPIAHLDPQLHELAGANIGGLIGGLPPGSLQPNDPGRTVTPGLVAGTVTT